MRKHASMTVVYSLWKWRVQGERHRLSLKRFLWEAATAACRSPAWTKHWAVLHLPCAGPFNTTKIGYKFPNFSLPKTKSSRVGSRVRRRRFFKFRCFCIRRLPMETDTLCGASVDLNHMTHLPAWEVSLISFYLRLSYPIVFQLLQ